ncbi:MAG: Hsp20/alpha crystallin family protein [Thermoplasmataceae archaeon]
MVYRKKREDEYDEDSFFVGMLDNFGIDFDRFNDRMKRMIEKIARDPEATTVGPFVYGFTYKTDQYGKPQFQEFGNVPGYRNPGISQATEKDLREPITDMNTDDSNVYVTFELPGINKEDIDLKVSEKNISLNVANGTRKYFKSIETDYKLKSETTEAKFVNGILDVKVALDKDEGQKSKKIKIS